MSNLNNLKEEFEKWFIKQTNDHIVSHVEAGNWWLDKLIDSYHQGRRDVVEEVGENIERIDISGGGSGRRLIVGLRQILSDITKK